MSKPLYVFDLDETLINGDCAMIWNEFLVEKGLVSDPNFIQEDERLMALYAQGTLSMEAYLDFAMSPLVNMPTDEVKALVSECVQSHILPKQFQQAKVLIEQLNQQKVDMIVISASVTFLVEEVAENLGVSSSIGIDLVEQSGCYSSKVKGVASYQSGKVTRLKAWLTDQGAEFSEVHFYTDSINDLPMCEFADYAYLVNPCNKLKQLGDRTNWQVLSWS